VRKFQKVSLKIEAIGTCPKHWNPFCPLRGNNPLGINLDFSILFKFFWKKLFLYAKMSFEILLRPQFLHFHNEWSSSIFKFFHIIWGFMMDNGFHYKNDLASIQSLKCQWSISFMFPSKFSSWQKIGKPPLHLFVDLFIWIP